MKRIKIYDMVITALFSALIAVFSQLSIPSPFGVPITLQTFIVALTGFVLGKYKGSISVLVYIAVGAVGVPVFTGFQGGVTALFGMTGGFILGFIPLVFFCGIKTNNTGAEHICLVLGVSICHLCGIFWFSFYSESLASAFFASSAPFFAKDILSIVAARFIAKKIKVITQKFN